MATKVEYDVVCSQCSKQFPRARLEAHIAADHLDYFPYGCGYCGHWLATDELAVFHAQRKQHLPVKIRENPDFAKERRLRELLESSTGEPANGAFVEPTFSSFTAWQTASNSASPSSVALPRESRDADSPQSNSSQGDRRRKFADSVISMQSFEWTPAPRGCTSAASVERDDTEVPVQVQVPVMQVHNHKSHRSGARARKRPKRFEPSGQKPADDDSDAEVPQTGEDGREKKLCNICQLNVKQKDIKTHVRRHIMTRPLAGCNYCNYRGRSLNSVRVHITWKHAGRSTKPGIGAKDLSEVDSTFHAMYDKCFGATDQNQKLEGGDSLADPVAVSKSTGVLRPYAKRAAKSTGNSGTIKQFRSGYGLPLPPPGNSLQPTRSSTPRQSHSASGRLYKHLVCQECGQEVLDALASAHVYQSHINHKDMLQCPYCDYGTPYAIAEVKRHITTKHPDQPVNVIDKRQQPDVQELYVQWRSRCFPDIGHRRGIQTASDSSPDVSSTAPGTTESANSLLEQLFGKQRKEEKSLLNPEALNQSAFSALNQSSKSTPLDNVKSANARMKRTCAKCGVEITMLWLHRHCWRHLSEDEGINPFVCPIEDCDYATYLKRSMDSHSNYHGHSSSEQLGVTDNRQKFSSQYMKCMIECFGPDALSDSPSTPATTTETQEVQESPPPKAITPAASDRSNIQRGAGIAATPLDAWCQKCQCGFARDEAEEHVWQAHLGGVLPFRCGRCQKAFLELSMMESHWTSEHSTGAHGVAEMEVIEEPDAKSHFENQMVECFPEMDDQRRIKLEPPEAH